MHIIHIQYIHTYYTHTLYTYYTHTLYTVPDSYSVPIYMMHGAECVENRDFLQVFMAPLPQNPPEIYI